MKRRIKNLISIFPLLFILIAEPTIASTPHKDITTFLMKEMGGLYSARTTLSQAHFFLGDTNITPSKTIDGARGDINLAQDLAKAFNRVTKQKWAVAMSNIAVGKFRKGWALANTQVFKSTSGTIKALIGDHDEEGLPGVSELDGTVAAINLTLLGCEELSLDEIKERFFPGEELYRVATAEETINFDNVIIGKSLVFEGIPDSGKITDVFFDHAVMRLTDGEITYTALNLGSVIGAKYKNWTLASDLDFSQLLAWDEKIYDLCIQLLHESPYETALFTELRETLSNSIPYALFDGMNLKRLLNRKIEKESKEELEARAYLQVVLSHTLDIVGFEGEKEELINKNLKKIGDVKTFLKIPGQILCSMGIGSPTGGFDLSHVPKEAISSLSPANAYMRVAKYVERNPNNVVLLSEALVGGFAESKYGKFEGDVSRDWNSWSKEANLASWPLTSFDLGVLAHRSAPLDFERDDFNTEAPFLLLNHGERNIINVHFSGDGPRNGVSERVELLEQLEFCEEVDANDFNKVFPKDTSKNRSEKLCGVCGYKGISRGEDMFMCVR